MIRETSLSVNDLILPLFVIAGKDVKSPIPSMPGHFNLSIDHFLKTAQQAYGLGIPAIIIFGIPEKKDALGTEAYAENGIVQKATKALKEIAGPGCHHGCVSVPIYRSWALRRGDRQYHR
jgi:porphobilinogen synthase